MYLKRLELVGFKSFARKDVLFFDVPVTAIVGPNGSGKSNVAEAFRWVLGEQSMKTLRGKRGEDLIFNGSNSGSRQNRASVSLVLSNEDRKIDLDFDEVTITRTVYRDGNNEYAINGSVVRLKDVLELLSNISLGSGGHHIISQGEADRILSSSLSDRKEIIEESLGLTNYQWKIDDCLKKIDKTNENIKQAESLRREIAPHLRFLNKQVEKITKADEMRRELKNLYIEYLYREDEYLSSTRNILNNKKNPLLIDRESLRDGLQKLENNLASQSPADNYAESIATAEKKIRDLRQEKDNLSRQLGRLEGLIEVKQELSVNKTQDDSDVLVSVHEIDKLIKNIKFDIDQKIDIDNSAILKQLLTEIKNKLTWFLDNIFKNKDTDNKQQESDNLDNWLIEKEDITKQIKQIKQIEQVESLEQQKILDLKNLQDKFRESTRGAERELFELKSKLVQINSSLDALESEIRSLDIEADNFKRELDEAVVLVDREVLDYKLLAAKLNLQTETRQDQDNRRRLIEKIKIRLEDLGIDRGDVLEEYKEVSKRDEFLAKELDDLNQSLDSLSQIIKELQLKLSTEFSVGLEKINIEFNRFFGLMFDGGSASLVLIKELKRKRNRLEESTEEDEYQDGIDIRVNLPRKKIKGLEMLSGGERALTSIALLFAMSQVNPPPFLILDETDAALDEANSRKYGDMISGLSKKSQLIVITHNRETMSRAGILYGITMGNDGVSKLLSIKLEQASGYAK